jgi:hypothetical protein
MELLIMWLKHFYKTTDYKTINNFNFRPRKMALLHPLDGYYSFDLYEMQTAFYLVLLFFFELFYNCVLSRRVYC